MFSHSNFSGNSHRNSDFCVSLRDKIINFMYKSNEVDRLPHSLSQSGGTPSGTRVNNSV